MPKHPETADDLYKTIVRLGAQKAAVLIHEWLNPLPPSGSVRVRIAVGFDADGDWMPFGGANAQDYDTVQEAQHYRHAARIVWIEADIPPPAPEPVVAGRVVDAS